MAYATVSDIEQRWRVMSEEEREIAAVKLEDAATLIDQRVGEKDVPFEVLKIVSCNMVMRSMGGEADAYGFGGSEESPMWNPTVPAKPVKMYREDLTMLGIGSRVGTWSVF